MNTTFAGNNFFIMRKSKKEMRKHAHKIETGQ